MRQYCLVFIGWVFAQSKWCGFEEYALKVQAEDPEVQIRQAILESATPLIQHHRLLHTEMECKASRFIIPVVFHVIYSSPSDSISYQRIWNQMLRVFEDFRRIPETPGYAGVGVDSEIEFSLATKDPDGNPTTGVVYWRYDQPPLNWTSRDFCREAQDISMKQATGWDRNKYLNIWIVPRLCVATGGSNTCNSCNSVAGYAYFPSSGPTIYGTVIGSDYFWGSGNSRSIRTLVHELGHNLNLYHTFQDGCGGSNCNTTGDHLCDTPPTAENNFSVARQNTCNNDLPDLPDNPRNYMDYVNDIDMAFFSAGQVARSWTAINTIGSRLYSLSRTTNQQVTGTGPYGQVKAYFSAYPRQGCAGYPIRFYSYSMGKPHIHEWSFSGGTPDDPSASCPTVIYSQPGGYDVELIVENLSGRRDTLRKNGYIQILDTLYPLPYEEGFEGNTFPPAHTFIDNPDFNRTWERFRSTTPPRGAYGASRTSMRVLFFNYSRYREKDSWVTPPLDLRSYTDPDLDIYLRFSWAYACLEYENPSASPPSYLIDYVDSLRIYVSTDCGSTWQLLWERGGRDLSTYPGGCIFASGSLSNASFLPSSTDWATDSILLNAYKGLAPIRIRFEAVSGWGNNLFIDDISVDTVYAFASAISGPRSSQLSAYVSEGVIYFHTKHSLPELKIEVYDIQGRLVQQETITRIGEGHHRYSLSPSLSSGFYFIKIYTESSCMNLRYWHSP
ncbi:MAG: M43 family zinc metalloprotease [Bacteroidia bacterium]|nr:M43 family zinc metalloprotease [Bacteroidia bacterium]